ncbi:MAG: PEP-CTERM sorting domain-containing protein [Alphaproteobacteria bacterium]|nr:PEP-CTERM sorting domain-containing protein [Alphaproteobacteria bacterium]
MTIEHDPQKGCKTLTPTPSLWRRRTATGLRLAIGGGGLAAILATVSPTPASATLSTYDLNVTFGPSLIGPPLAGATLTGSYSYDGLPVGQSNTFFPTSWDISIFGPSSNLLAHLFTFDGGKSSLAIGDESGFDEFQMNDLFNNSGFTVQLLFPESFAGTGDVLLPDPGQVTKGSDALTDGLVIVFAGSAQQTVLPVVSGTSELAGGANTPQPPATVSEPTSLVLVGAGLAALAALRQRRRPTMAAA